LSGGALAFDLERISPKNQRGIGFFAFGKILIDKRFKFDKAAAICDKVWAV
jgi:hypothetical protein